MLSTGIMRAGDTQEGFSGPHNAFKGIQMEPLFLQENQKLLLLASADTEDAGGCMGPSRASRGEYVCGFRYLLGSEMVTPWIFGHTCVVLLQLIISLTFLIAE